MRRREGRKLSKGCLKGATGDAELSPAARSARLGEIQGWTSALASVALVIVKGILAAWSGSVALLADALNNLGDLAGSLVLIFGFRLSSKPRDPDHPYGHGRLRTVAGLVLSIILIVVGIEAARSGILRILDPAPVTAGPWVLAAVLAAILFKAGLAVFAHRMAALTGDAALKSEFWNHFFDILSTALVLLALVCARYDLPAVDGWAGVVISGFIVYTGIRYAGETTGILIGKAPSREALHEVRRIAGGVAGVEGVHDIQIHEYGNMRLIVLHVEMDAAMSAMACHALTEQVEDRIAGRFQAKVIVHGDPVNVRHPAYRTVAAALDAVVDEAADLVDFHDLRVSGDRAGLVVEVDLVTRISVASADFGAKAADVYRQLTAKVDGIARLDVGIETSYASEPEFRAVFPPG